MNGGRINKRRIFITGGACGLGRALAERYARAGWRVCIGDLDAERCADALAAIRAHSPQSHALACDVTREDALQAAADWLQREWGGVDVVVNNAGVAQMGGIAETSLEDWRWAVDINLLGVVRGCKVFAPLLAAQGGGRLVNIASMAGLVHMPQASAYNATKAAVEEGIVPGGGVANAHASAPTRSRSASSRASNAATATSSPIPRRAGSGGSSACCRMACTWR